MRRPVCAIGLAGETRQPAELRHLPEPGGALDQGAWLMDAMEFLNGQVFARARETGDDGRDLLG